jgi:hypothetical protein
MTMTNSSKAPARLHSTKDALGPQLTCRACGGAGRSKTTGTRCDVCRGTGCLTASGAGREPMALRTPGTPSGWGEGYYSEDSVRRAPARLHHALDCLMDRKVARDASSECEGCGKKIAAGNFMCAACRNRPKAK